MDVVLFEQNKVLVLQALEEGEFDYIDAASEVFETEFFRHIEAESILSELATSYPTPREKKEVPLVMFIAGNLTLRLHGQHAFHAFPMVVRVGGMLNAFGPQVGRKVIHPDTGDVTLACQGFNRKNRYDRQTPCDHDYLRKLAKDTDAEALMQWYGRDVVKIFKNRHAFDEEGVFIGDASYLFVPDNPNYEGSSKLRFDEHDHPVSREAYAKMTAEQQARCQWRRCYKMVSLLHTSRKLGLFMYVAVRVLPGKSHECPVLYELVEEFVGAAGKGVMKQLILDRGFLDGEAISRCKKRHNIDVLIPVRRDMDIYKDAAALFLERDVNWTKWMPREPTPRKTPRPPPADVVRREKARQKTLKKRKEAEPPPPPDKTLVKSDVAAIGGFRSWSSCEVPLTVVANREQYADGRTKVWFLLTTKKARSATTPREEYQLRTAIEERHRQLKCFCDLTKFTSRAFSLVVNQVVFVMLAYSLLQFYLRNIQREELNTKTPPSIWQQLRVSDRHIIVYWKSFYAFFQPLEYTQIVVTLAEEARQKIANRCGSLLEEFKGLMQNPRPM